MTIPHNPAAMTRRRVLLVSLAVPAAAETAASDRPLVFWTPLAVFVGAPVLFRAKTYSGPGTWLEKKIEFRPDTEHTFSALAGVGLDRAPGAYPLVFDGQTVEVAVRPTAILPPQSQCRRSSYNRPRLPPNHSWPEMSRQNSA